MSEDSLMSDDAPDGDAEAPSWHWTESVPGEGDKPEWLLDKYASVDKQAEAYVALQEKLGSFTGAPDGEDGLFGYSTENFVPETVEGFELNEEDPFLQGFVPLLKELNLSQDGMDKLVQHYIGMMADEQQQAEATKAQQMEALGPNAAKRLSGLQDYLKANLDGERYDAIRGAMVSAAAIEAMEKLVAKARGASMNKEDVGAPTITKEELQRLQMAVDENGNRKMQSDPEYRKYVRSKMRDVYGDGVDIEIVG